MLEKISRKKNRISWYLGKTKKAVQCGPYCFFSIDVFSYSLCYSLSASPAQSP